jgi:class 3 adenylate cyclase
VFSFNLGSRKTVKTLSDVAYGKTEIISLEESEVYHLQRAALQFPMVVSVITFMIWILAGFIFGFIEPLIAGKIFNIETPNLIYCLRQFLGISILGGGITTLILYFVLENAWRNYISREIRDEIIAGKTSLVGEMKRVTLLFSDLRNFTTLVEQNHPTHVITIINQYFNEMTLAVKANKGLVLQYVGDEIEAVFGAPICFDDHPDMAVKAALEMRKCLDALNMRLEHQGFEPLSHGIGIHSGAVLAGNIGSEERMSYALVGDTVNSASRIEKLTKQYESDIIISQTTFNLLTEAYDTEQLASVKVKGKEDEIIIYKVL